MSGKDKGKEPISPISNPPDSMPSTSRTSQINEPILAAIQEAVHSAINPIQDTVAQLTETFINRMDAQESQTSGLDRIVTNLQDQINGSGSANRVNQSSTRTTEHDYGHPSGATVPNVTTTPRVPSAVPPSGYNFAGIPRAVQQNPLYHPQQTSGTHVATDPSNPHPDAVYHSESWGSTAHPPEFTQRQPEPPYGIPVSQPPLPPGPFPRQPTPPTGFPQQHLSPPPGFSSQQTAQPSVIPPLQPSSLNGSIPQQTSVQSDFSFQQPTGSHHQPQPSTQTGTPHMNNVDPVPLSAIEEDIFRNGFSTQPPLPEDPPPMRRMNSQLPRQHERETQVPLSPILSAKEIVGLLETRSEPSTVDKFETPIGGTPFSKLNQNEQKIVLDNHKQALTYVMQTDFARQHHLSRFVENFIFDKTVQQKDLEAIDFLYRLRNWYKQFLRQFNPKYTYMNEKFLMTFVLDRVFRQPQVANESNGAYTWFNSRILAGIKDTMDSFVNDFRLKFVSSRIKEHCENFIKDTEFNPNENMDTFFSKINYATQLYFYGTGEACSDEAVSRMIRNSISRGSEDLYRQLCTMFQGSIDGIDFTNLTAALQRLEKSHESQQAENEARSSSRIRSQTIHLGGPSIKTKPRISASFRHYDGSSSPFSSAAQFSSPGQSNYSVQNSCHALVASANDEDQICETCSSDHERRGADRDVENTDALAYRDEFLLFSKNVSVRSEADFSEELDNLTSVGDLGLSAQIYDNDPALFVIRGSDGKALATGKFKCRNCQGDHFLRDCPKLEGSGISTVGQAIGSAKGFREGEDPPQEYKEAREKNAKRRRAIAAAAAIKRRRGSRGSSQTTAQIRRRSEATNPPKHIYQSLLKEELTDVFNSNSSNVEPRYLSLYARLADADILYFSDVKDPAFP